MLLDCIPAPALVLPAPGWQVTEQAHAASAQEQRLLRLAQVHALLGEVAERERAVITLRYGLSESQGECRCHSYREIGRLLALRPGHVCMLKQCTLRKLRLALTHYTPAQAGSAYAAVRPGGAALHDQGALPPRRGRCSGGPGQKVSLAGLCQWAQVSGRVAGAFLRERQRGTLTVAPQA